VRAIGKASQSSTLLAIVGIVVMSVLSYGAGERQAKPEYDFDVDCESDALIVESSFSDLEVFTCAEYGDIFVIKCDPKTVQLIGDDWYCKTFGGESVRIREEPELRRK